MSRTGSIFDSLRHVHSLVAAALIALLVASCGGGTSGTGDVGGDSQIKGMVRSTSGAPIAQAHIIHLETGAETTSNAAGEFELHTSLESANPKILVESSTFSSSVTLEGVPAGTPSLTTILEVSTDGIVSVASVHIGEIAEPSPLPSQSDTNPSASPKQTPSAVDTEQSRWQIQGRATTPSGASVSGANVTLSPGGVTTSTNSNGNFSATINAQGTSISIAVEYKGQRGKATVSNIPTGRSLKITLHITLTLDAAQIDPNNPDEPIPGALAVRVSSVSFE